MAAARRAPRETRCEHCQRLARSELTSRSICRQCYRREPKKRCARCGRSFHPVSASSTTCVSCARVIVRPTVRVPIPCPRCHRLRVPHLLSSLICQACWIKEHNGYARCRSCGRYKLVRVKSRTVCASCDNDQSAARSLRRFVTQYTSPFAYNKRLFEQLIERVDLARVDERQNRRLRRLGRFLQQHEMIAPVSWEQIDALMPVLPPRANRNKPKDIREALRDIGHLAAERGEIEPYDEYVTRRSARAPIAHAPLGIRPVLSLFADWLGSRQTKPSAIEHHLRALAQFWLWCAHRTIARPQEVNPTLIRYYLLGLYWQWRCTLCGAVTYCGGESELAPVRCSQCDQATRQCRVQRYAQNTIRRLRASVFMFFEWTKLVRRTMLNPVQQKVAVPEPTVQHYAPEVLQALAHFIVSSDSDPTAALLLYFIVFHLTTVHELRYLRLPMVISFDTKEVIASIASTPVLTLPKRQASVGIVHPGRAGGHIRFHHTAQLWLQPLLVRFERQRVAVIGSQGRSRYVFVTARSRIRNVPVSHAWVWDKVMRSTRAIVGYPCNAKMLRKTAAVYFADRVGAGILSRMGWEAQQAFAYTWVTRELLDPSDSASC